MGKHTMYKAELYGQQTIRAVCVVISVQVIVLYNHFMTERMFPYFDIEHRHLQGESSQQY